MLFALTSLKTLSFGLTLGCSLYQSTWLTTLSTLYVMHTPQALTASLPTGSRPSPTCLASSFSSLNTLTPARSARMREVSYRGERNTEGVSLFEY